jgi:hypothetical protein
MGDNLVLQIIAGIVATVVGGLILLKITDGPKGVGALSGSRAAVSPPPSSTWGNDWTNNSNQWDTAPTTQPQSGGADTVARSDTITFELTNRTANEIEITFYSSDRQAQWPTSGNAYFLSPGATASYPLQCNFSGETVCYGAWPRGSAGAGGWGVGLNQSIGCNDCCVKCQGGKLAFAMQ